MMEKSGFELCTIVTRNKSFWEYKSIEDMTNDQGEEELNNVVGYFEPNTNYTIEEIEKLKEENEWAVCCIDKGGSHKLFTFSNTLELKMELHKFVEMQYGEGYTNIYKLSSMIYV